MKSLTMQRAREREGGRKEPRTEKLAMVLWRARGNDNAIAK